MVAAARRLSIETFIIAAIGITDLALTIALVSGQRAYEGNPIMSFYLSHGLGAFVAMKVVLTLMPLVILEWARRTRPDFVRRLSRVGIAAYVGMYGVMFLKVNIPTILSQRAEANHVFLNPGDPNNAGLILSGSRG